MWIETTAGTTRLYDPEIDTAVTFNDNGTAQVAAEVGEYLCEHYPAIEPYESDSDSDGDGDD